MSVYKSYMKFPTATREREGTPLLLVSKGCDWGGKMRDDLQHKGYQVKMVRSDALLKTPQICVEDKCAVGFIDIPEGEPSLGEFIRSYCSDGSMTASNCVARRH